VKHSPPPKDYTPPLYGTPGMGVDYRWGDEPRPYPGAWDRRAEINALARELRGRIARGMFYGRPVDMNNPDEVLVAAWAAGMEEYLDDSDD
jgi:hypothetical protein